MYIQYSLKSTTTVASDDSRKFTIKGLENNLIHCLKAWESNPTDMYRGYIELAKMMLVEIRAQPDYEKFWRPFQKSGEN